MSALEAEFLAMTHNQSLEVTLLAGARSVPQLSRSTKYNERKSLTKKRVLVHLDQSFRLLRLLPGGDEEGTSNHAWP